MKRYLYIILMALFISCNNYLPGFDFENFKGTKAYKLAKAVENQDVKKIEEIVKGDNNLIDFLDPKFGHSLLMLSVANGLDKSASKLLALGANPNKKSSPTETNSEVTTAVFIACNKIYKRNCKTHILEILIKNGGDINDKIDVRYVNAKYVTKETPLMIATNSNCINLVKKVVELGADINDYNYLNGKGPLSNCIIHDNIDILEYLVIERNAEIPSYVFIRPAHNNTPREELTLIEFLNEQTYSKNSKNEKYKTSIINYIKNKK
jgi:uncharacterized protein